MTPEQAAKEYADRFYPIKDYDSYQSDYDYRTQDAKNRQLQEHFLAGVEYGKEWVSVETPPELTEPLIGYNDDNEREVIIENFKATVLGYNPEIGIFNQGQSTEGY